MKRNQHSAKFCAICGEELNKHNHYLDTAVCKQCLREMIDINSLDSVYDALRFIDKPFISELWHEALDGNNNKDKVIGNYMRYICLPQYKKENFKDEGKSFIEQRVENLKKEAENLDKKISIMNEQNNFGTYKNLIQAYTEVLRLIERYDWQLKYSEYFIGCDTDDGQSFSGKQVAIWEQNTEGNIRNHKVWDIKDDVSSSIKVNHDNGNYREITPSGFVFKK